MKIVKVEAEPQYNITGLTKHEAQVLYDLCGMIGGSPDGPKGVTDNLYSELEGLGFRDRNGVRITKAEPTTDAYGGNVYIEKRK